jgi:hypothetical protein
MPFTCRTIDITKHGEEMEADPVLRPQICREIIEIGAQKEMALTSILLSIR